MSPEQALGRPVDERSDVFSFGVVLYEMLSGTRPFRGPTIAATLVAIVHDAAPPLHEHVPEVDEATEAIVTRCLSKAPAERFANAGEVVAALSRPSPEMPAGQATRRPRRWTLALGLGSLLLAVAGAVTATTVMRRPTAPVASASAAPRATTMIDLPPPPTQVAAAAQEYAQAMQAWRDASIELGHKHIFRAVQLDPHFALAHLMIAMWRQGSIDEQRQHLATVVEASGSSWASGTPRSSKPNGSGSRPTSRTSTTRRGAGKRSPTGTLSTRSSPRAPRSPAWARGTRTRVSRSWTALLSSTRPPRCQWWSVPHSRRSTAT